MSTRRSETVRIAIRPEDERGGNILDDLESLRNTWAELVASDGTRRYRLDENGARVDAFVADLDRLRADWREHLTYFGVTQQANNRRVARCVKTGRLRPSHQVEGRPNAGPVPECSVDVPTDSGLPADRATAERR